MKMNVLYGFFSVRFGELRSIEYHRFLAESGLLIVQ